LIACQENKANDQLSKDLSAPFQGSASNSRSRGTGDASCPAGLSLGGCNENSDQPGKEQMRESLRSQPLWAVPDQKSRTWKITRWSWLDSSRQAPIVVERAATAARRFPALVSAARCGTSASSSITWREARVASALNHPNIIMIHEVIEKPRAAAILMELVSGVALRTAAKNNPPLDEVLRWLRAGSNSSPRTIDWRLKANPEGKWDGAT
jgi:hypothetical protein